MRIKKTYRLIIMVVAVSVLSVALMHVNQPEPTAPVEQPTLPMSFAGEALPHKPALIARYWSHVDFAAANLRNSPALRQRIKMMMPEMEAILRRENVPTDLKYVALVESMLDYNVVSPTGATGIWQLQRQAASYFGLFVNHEVDERLNLRLSTIAAARYFKYAHKEYHNWTLAAASYNMGVNGLTAALKRQNKNNYYDLKLNKETSDFVFKILAYREVLENPEKYNVYGTEPELSRRLIRFETKNKVTHLDTLAATLETTVEVIRQYNPWIKGGTLTAVGHRRSYVLYVPDNKPEEAYVAESE